MNDSNIKPLVSVILATYNEPVEFLHQAVNSILEQTLSNIELLIIDDSTNVDTILKINEFSKDSRVKIIREVNRIGFVKALNIGIKLSEGKYIARMDGDDISHHSRLEKQVDYLKIHPDVDCLGTWALEINEKGEEFFKKNMPITHEECFAFFKKRDCMIHPSVMYRRSYFEKAGLYLEDCIMDEDTMMWAQGFKNGCVFANIPEYLVSFRIDSDFFERRGGWKHLRSYYLMRVKINKMLKYGFDSNLYAFIIAFVKLMPKSILRLIYKSYR